MEALPAEGLQVTPHSQLQSPEPARSDANSDYPQQFPHEYYQGSYPAEKPVYHEPDVAAARAGEPRRICGVRRTTFWLLLALAALLIGAAVAIGVVASRPKTSARSEVEQAQRLGAATPTTVTVTTTATSSSTATPTLKPITGCPDANNKIYDAVYGGRFKKYCNRDFASRDLQGIMVASLDLCIEACASYNAQSEPSLHCDGVAFIPSWSERESKKGEKPSNCVLKTDFAPQGQQNMAYEVDTAILQSSPE